MEKVYYKNEIRLGQALKLSGYAENGGLAKAMIQDGAVYLNSEVETRRGRQLQSGDVVMIDFADEPVSFEVIKE